MLKAQLNALAFSADGKVLACGCKDELIPLWNPGTGRRVDVLAGHGSATAALAFSPAGRLLAGLGYDETLRLWDVTTGQEQAHMDKPAWQNSAEVLAFSPDGRTIASGGLGFTILWEVATHEIRWVIAYHPADAGCWGLGFSPDGRLLASVGGPCVILWSAIGWESPVTLAPGDFEVAWADLAGSDAERAYAAICRLIGNPTEAVRQLRSRLRRAPRPDRVRLGLLIRNLDSGEFAIRQEASRQLAALGEDAGIALEEALRGPLPPEARRRALVLLKEHRPSVPPPEQLREVRAVEILEYIGTAEAQQVLEDLSHGASGVRLTEEAVGSLRRLRQRVVVIQGVK